jgi:hypothetical protein
MSGGLEMKIQARPLTFSILGGNLGPKSRF